MRERAGASGPVANVTLAVLMATIGGLAGATLGYVLVTFTLSIGEGGWTGTNAAPFADADLAAMLALSGGLPLGAILTPIVYFRQLRRTPLSLKWLLLPSATLAGGMLGAVVGGLGGALWGGAVAFWASAAGIRLSSSPGNASQRFAAEFPPRRTRARGARAG